MNYLTRSSAYDPFRTMRRVLDSMEASMDTMRPGSLWSTTEVGAITMDVTSDDNAVIVRAELPGVKEEDIDIKVDNGVLTVSAETKYEHEDKQETYHLREMRYGQFSRSVRLPEEVNTEKAEAELDNGVLTITLPRSKPNPAKQIAVKARNLLHKGKDK